MAPTMLQVEAGGSVLTLKFVLMMRHPAGKKHAWKHIYLKLKYKNRVLSLCLGKTKKNVNNLSFSNCSGWCWWRCPNLWSNYDRANVSEASAYIQWPYSQDPHHRCWRKPPICKKKKKSKYYHAFPKLVPSLTFLTHAVIVAFVVEASVVRFTLVLSQVATGTFNKEPRDHRKWKKTNMKAFCQRKSFPSERKLCFDVSIGLSET